MLNTRWHLSDDTNSAKLQAALLSSSLVNSTGRSDGFKAIDLLLEHLNCAAKIEMRNYKNSTHDAEKSFDGVMLTNGYIRELRDSLEDVFGQYNNPEHTSRDARADMFHLASTLFKDGLTSPRAAHNCPTGPRSSPDIFNTGISVLESKVAEFNARRGRTGLDVNTEADDDFVALDEMDIDDADNHPPPDPTEYIARGAGVETLDLSGM